MTSAAALPRTYYRPTSLAALAADVALSKADLIRLICRVADQLTIPRRLLLACALAEGGRSLNPSARRPADPADDERYWNPPNPFDVSVGLFQQTLRWCVEYADWCRANGHAPDAFPGTDVVESLMAPYLDPEYAARVAAKQLHAHRLTWQAAGDDFRTLCLYNWPAGGGEPYSPAHASNYRTALVEADQLLGAPSVPPTSFDPNVPVILQRQNWTCSAVTLAQMLNSIGRPTTEDAAVALLGPSRITSAYGLMDATGSGLAACLREQGLDAGNIESLSWEQAVATAGTRPFGMGGRRWGESGHWAFCHGYDPAAQALLFKNSASDYLSVMNRDQFNARGPWSAVFINVASEPDFSIRVRELERALEQAQADLKVARDTLGYLTHEVAAALRTEHGAILSSLGALEAAINTLERHAPA